jgi:hypothetical protein
LHHWLDQLGVLMAYGAAQWTASARLQFLIVFDPIDSGSVAGWSGHGAGRIDLSNSRGGSLAPAEVFRK